MYILKIKHNKRWILIQKMFKDRILKCILCSISPTIYVNKVNTLLASLTEEHLQREVTSS